MRKWLPVVPIVFALALGAVAYKDLPTDVPLAFEGFLPVPSADETMNRTMFVLLVPLVATLTWAGLALLARTKGSRDGVLPERLAAAAVERFEPTYDAVVLGVVVLLVAMHVGMVATAVAWPAWTLKANGVVLGVGLMIVGNLMPRVRPNWIVGVRTRATLADPALWLRTHRYFGALLMLSGLAVIVVALVAVRYTFVALLAGFLVSAILAHARASRKPGPVPGAGMALTALLWLVIP